MSGEESTNQAPMAPELDELSSISGPAGSSPSVSWTGGDPRDAASSFRPFELLENYQILRRLGGGGMADVYLARAALAEGVDKLVALKTVLPQFGRETRMGSLFLDEARVSATLHHPNIVQVFDYGEAAGRPYMAMEYIRGRDLGQIMRHLRDLRRLPPPGFVIAVGLEICKALEYVHERRDLDGQPLNLVHRDVSPGNVLLSERSEVKLVDFGVASADGSTDATSGMLVGKLRYLTREHAAGEPPDPGWDLFALGVVLYELSTLRRPWRVTSAESLLRNEVRDERVLASQINSALPVEFAELLMQVTERDSRLRPGSAAELRASLARIARSLPTYEPGRLVRGLFGHALDTEEREVEGLIGEARKRSRQRPGAVLVQLWRRVRSAITGSALYRRRPWLVLGGAAALGLALLGGTGAALISARAASRLESTLAEVDRRVSRRQLAGASGDQALDHLLAAREDWPDEPRLQARLVAFADTFARLGEQALARGDLFEAASHLQVALKADPRREDLARQLREVEARILQSASGRVSAGAPRAP